MADKFQLGRLGESSEHYASIIDALNNGTRFVVTLPTLAVTEESHQTVVTIVDLFESRVIVATGESMSLFLLMDAAGVDFPIERDGGCLVDFMSWLASTFCRQYAGVIEVDGDPDMVLVKQLIDSGDGPDLVLWIGKGYSSLMVFDPYDCIYRVIETWIEGYCSFVPGDIQAAVDSIMDVKLYALIIGLRQAAGESKPIWFEKISRYMAP